MKGCTKCLQVLPLESFNRDCKGRDGRKARCRDCLSTRCGELTDVDGRRFPLRPLLRCAGVQLTPGDHTEGRANAAAMLRVSLTTFDKWMLRGLSWGLADEAACAAGLHPGDVWPEWLVNPNAVEFVAVA